MTCPSASRCWAVGFTLSGTAGGTLAERWNGTNWTVVHAPTSSDDELVSDSCSSTSNCVATGSGGNMFATAGVRTAARVAEPQLPELCQIALHSMA